MNRTIRSGNPLLLLGASLLIAVGLFAIPAPSSARSWQEQSDNTKMNKGDANKDATTADQQKMNAGDRAITQKIRAEIMKDKSLSTYAHNIKIITQDGKVTLKGPVRTTGRKEPAMEDKGRRRRRRRQRNQSDCNCSSQVLIDSSAVGSGERHSDQKGRNNHGKHKRRRCSVSIRRGHGSSKRLRILLAQLRVSGHGHIRAAPSRKSGEQKIWAPKKATKAPRKAPQAGAGSGAVLGGTLARIAGGNRRACDSRESARSLPLAPSWRLLAGIGVGGAVVGGFTGRD